MKKSSLALVAAALMLAAAAPAAAAHTCLNTADIEGHDSPNGTTILFHMHDGSTWRNTLQGVCNGLRYRGFVWNLHNSNQVCEDEQTLKVIGTGETCILGKFEKVSGPRG